MIISHQPCAGWTSPSASSNDQLLWGSTRRTG
jgi:hypothetical protein